MKKSTFCKVFALAVAFAVPLSAYPQSAAVLATQSNRKQNATVSSVQSNQPEVADRSADEIINNTKDNVPNAQLAMSALDYPVTAGDVYTLAFAAGSTPVSYSVPVDSTYKIRIANLGVIDCAGLTYVQLKQQVVALVQRNYPMGGAQFVLTAPAVFMVSITGEVKSATERKVWALMRLSSFVKSSFTEYSSSRTVAVVSADGTEKQYDLFKAERDGDFSQNPYLRPGDKIIVPRFERKVAISGAVERPGSYELLDGENLKMLINYYASGLEAVADTSRIVLYRKIAVSSGAGEKFYLNERAVESDYALECYDSIHISSYDELKPVVFVEGAIQTSISDTALEASNRISVTFDNGEDYAFFVRENRSWFSSVSDTANAYIIRGDKHIPLNLNPMLYDASYYSNELIQANDTLIIPFRQYFVSVSGAVNNPGRYPYIPDRTWEYYIGLAGGFIASQNARQAITMTDINGKRLSKNDIITPETTIEAKTNSGLYYFNQYAPVLTTILSIISTSISLLVVSGAI